MNLIPVAPHRLMNLIPVAPHCARSLSPFPFLSAPIDFRKWACLRPDRNYGASMTMSKFPGYEGIHLGACEWHDSTPVMKDTSVDLACRSERINYRTTSRKSRYTTMVGNVRRLQFPQPIIQVEINNKPNGGTFISVIEDFTQTGDRVNLKVYIEVGSICQNR